MPGSGCERNYQIRGEHCNRRAYSTEGVNKKMMFPRDDFRKPGLLGSHLEVGTQTTETTNDLSRRLLQNNHAQTSPSSTERFQVKMKDRQSQSSFNQEKVVTMMTNYGED